MFNEYVLDISVGTKRTKVAYLIGFDVDKSVLKSDHQTWLEKVGWLARQYHAWFHEHPEASFNVWVYGTTSRTASFGHNLILSKSRAQAVERHLQKILGVHKGNIPYVIHKTGLSEVLAAMQLKSESQEDPLDRGVIVYAGWYFKPNPPPPKVRRPPGKVSYLALRFISAQSVSVTVPVKKVGKVGLEAYDVIVQIYDRKNHVSACYQWRGVGFTGGISKGSKISHPEIRFDGPWHPFEDPYARAPKDFSGPAMLDAINSSVEWLNVSYFYFGGGGYTKVYSDKARVIKNFNTGIPTSSVSLITGSTQRGSLKLVTCPAGLAKEKFKISDPSTAWIPN